MRAGLEVFNAKTLNENIIGTRVNDVTAKILSKKNEDKKIKLKMKFWR